MRADTQVIHNEEALKCMISESSVVMFLIPSSDKPPSPETLTFIMQELRGMGLSREKLLMPWDSLNDLEDTSLLAIPFIAIKFIGDDECQEEDYATEIMGRLSMAAEVSADKDISDYFEVELYAYGTLIDWMGEERLAAPLDDSVADEYLKSRGMSS